MLTYGDSLADKACNLECVDHLPPVHEFVGPVKIVLMDVPKAVYTKKAWISALVAFAEILIGAAVMTVLFYTLAFKTPFMMNVHIVLCTIGFQLLMPAAILMQNNLHGPSAVLKPPDRTKQHMLLQICCLVCAGLGGTLVLVLGPGSFNSKLSSIHSLAGLTASGLAVWTVLLGPMAYYLGDGRLCKNNHAVFGVLTLIASSVCFCLGVFNSKTFKAWAPMTDMVYVLIVLCCVYTAIVIAMPLMKIFNSAP